MVTSSESAALTPPSTRRAWLRLLSSPLLMALVFFPAAGRVDWFAAWVFIALVFLLQVQVVLTLQRTAPDLLHERSRLQANAKSWDKPLAALIALVFPLLTWLVAGLDQRYRWSALMPFALQVAGFFVAAVSAELTAWAMAVNRFFSAVVRLQTDRGHTVVSSAPYSYVRHPGYTGMIGFNLSVPLALGSYACFILCGACVLVMVFRTFLEDRFLRADLPGYDEYARRVRWRLIPFVW